MAAAAADQTIDPIKMMLHCLFKLQKDNFDAIQATLGEIKNEQEVQNKKIDFIGATIVEIRGWYIQNTSDIIEPEVAMTTQDETNAAVRNLLEDSRWKESEDEDAVITPKQEPSSQQGELKTKVGESSRAQPASRKRKAEDQDSAKSELNG
jgi:hypothetical protein